MYLNLLALVAEIRRDQGSKKKEEGYLKTSQIKKTVIRYKARKKQLYLKSVRYDAL